jgi:hypothetical protein
MKITEYKKHFSAVHQRVRRMNPKKNQLAVGAPEPIEKYSLVGYMHKTRLHKTDLTIKDFDYLRYMMPAGDNYHYFEGEMSIKNGRKGGQVIRKVLICKYVG